MKVIARLSTLQKQDSAFELHGAESHRYQLDSCLSDSNVQAWENENSLKLCPDFRSFVTRVGRGVGPGHGLFEFPPVDPRRLNELAQRFPYGPRDYNSFANSAKDQAALGTLHLADYGNGTTALVVVRGVGLGRVWIHHLDDELMAPLKRTNR